MAFRDLIEHGSEERNLEYKRTMSWDDNATKNKVLKASMAMANIPDGGIIIFGVNEEAVGISPSGMEKEHADSFNQDDVSEYVNGYADPFVELKVTKEQIENKFFVIIQVQGFSELPIICKKDGARGIFKGAIYTRSRKKYESVLVPSQTEMREIINLAVDKQIRRNIKNMIRWGIMSHSEAVESDAELFNEQLGGL